MNDSSRERPSALVPEKENGLTGFARSPALTVLIALACGILADAYNPLSLGEWISFSSLAAFLWCLAFYQKRNTVSACLLLVLLFCMGGLRHHIFWFCHAPNHISRVFDSRLNTEDASHLVRVTGVVNSTPQTKIPDDEEQFNPDQPQQRTTLILSCQKLNTGQAKLPVSGNVLVTIYDPADPGKSVPYSMGDTIEVCGKLKRISGRRNPRDFDFSQYYRKQQIEARLTVQSSEAILVTAQTADWSWNAVRHHLHDSVRQNILRHTSGESQGVALALLLGDRSSLSPEVRQNFSRSGLVHFLAISGLHIGFFSVAVWSLCHVFNLPRKTAVGLLVLAIGFYLSIIEIRPPVLRAASFCILVVLGLINWRTITTVNLVCISALIILLINPTDLFDPGTQLSFLAVAAILWTVQQDFYQKPFAQAWIPLRWQILASDPVLQTPLQGILLRLFRMFYSVFLITMMIWILTAPLVMFYFNLLAPVGLLINTLIFPFLFLVLSLGYLLIFVGPFLPWGTNLFGYCFDSSLSMLLGIVDFTAKIPGGHYELPSPPIWWLIGYYTFLLLAVSPIKIRNAVFSPVWLRKTRLALAPCWMIGGLLLPIMVPDRPALNCTFIAVDHGAAILIEAPAGHTVLYDAGSMTPVNQTYDKIRKTLLEHGIRRVDLLLISHADRDHYNAASRLIENQYVRAVGFPGAFLEHRQPGAVELSELAENTPLPVDLISKGDRLDLGSGALLQVLHPSLTDVFEEDNPASLTVLISYRGRKILLPGDLDGKGLQNLLAHMSPGPIDVLLSPHHGSRTANSRELAEWASPDFVIVSGGKPQNIPYLKHVYSPETTVYTTATDGAVNCRISSDGHLTVQTFRTWATLAH
ncbi:ComEC family competence protein [Gimesia panareensis]|uniref:ComEC family competence protein n=1 Tax=Gimesia panareensis TaxID=2527978 RepID=A0A517Q4J6_9PLAN|nr:ComEC/Rec2 family competence protein [Gimesia panareensis]QDT26537.1 ComEC family competence protein [Gimesia panareensis]